ncbi:MAG: division/cell wall cluster transcriptional repressor MraZ [Chitinophagales bacterium]|jgi:MraZ protein|nr:division/cell wall cluster transcriptional repressor MraZ [Bacteroidota bacterium]MBP9881343.1 division/cell wall cluster transcriptional repressor MraZ [Chitinophagales bacterium]MBK8343692.1 division/cell wall cluster transcriptional repressor MraZ [Bacteroidota bacterium]MBK9504482.1 division/cell wall cluster transcriptional repressor MraZ [Bacteroidota bacterium]MBK9557249.1 division/cell wall cluster transcriptional repressor MraZ [Bacteroidota bacterium]
MAFLIGEYECTLDVKQRIRVPAGLVSQLSGDDVGKFVITRGVDPCLYLYPMSEFYTEMDKINQIPENSEEDRDFKNMFYSGTSILTIDSAERILIPRLHVQHAGITKDMIMVCQKNKVVVWAMEKFREKYLNRNPADYQQLSEKVRGKYGI